MSFLNNPVIAQCNVVATAIPDSVCPGDPVILTVSYSCSGTLTENFNNGSFQSFLVPDTGASFLNPCNPTSDSSIYLWMGPDVYIPRTLSTVSLDATELVEISFDLKMATQGFTSPCEGPDEYSEGVTLQYSITGGSSWVNITYMQPDGSFLAANPWSHGLCINSPYITPFTSWANYSFAIPAAAKTTATIFRWIQEDYSSTISDHWGIDNIVLSTMGDVHVNWSTGDTIHTPLQVYPQSDTSFIVEVTSLTTGLSASDTVFIKVFQPSVNLSGGALWADTSYQYYFWIDCSTGLTVPGATAQSFTPQTNGSYALYATTQSGCGAQSDCIDYNSVDIQKYNTTGISIYPVPTSNEVLVSNAAGTETEYVLLDLSGKMLKHFFSDAPEFNLGLSAFSSGSYILKARNNSTVQTFRIEKM